MTVSTDDRRIAKALGDYGSSLMADALRDCGLTGRAAAPGLVPLRPDLPCAGRARTARLSPVDDPKDSGFEALASFVDSCRPGEVLVLAADEGTPHGAVWGELCTQAALARGCAGAVLDAYIRDVREIGASGLAMHSRGALSEDYLGQSKLHEHGEPVVLRGVPVAPGDWIVADADGVVSCPAGVVDEALEKAEAKRQAEQRLVAALDEGASLLEAVRRAGTL